jgi:hypothetical protein
MQYILIGGGALIALMVLYQMLRKANVRRLARWSRWFVGGALALLSAFLIFRGQIGIASITGPLAFVILRYGRIGNFSFEGTTLGEDNASSVRSRFIVMTLDHDSGTVEGRVIAGAFKGANLMDLGEEETRQLLGDVASDADSLALLETWLDKNRVGWRDYFAGKTASDGAEASTIDPDEEAYEILGLKPGAAADEIREAHHKLMKGVHPDQGGSNYLAVKINGAKDRLLKKVRR